MALPIVRFERFWDEPATLATGYGNINLKLETVAALIISLGIGWLLWGKLGFPLRLPGVNFDFSAIAPELIAVPIFVSYKLATIRRTAFDLLEGLLSGLITPRVVPLNDAQLIPLVLK